MMFISTKEFAARAKLDRRSAAKILKQAHADGRAWREHSLVVQEVTAHRGGRAGSAYQVDVRSLPEHLAFSSAAPAATGEDLLDHEVVLGANPKIPSEIARRYRAVAHAAEAPRASELRRDRVVGAAIREGVSRATVYRWLNAFESEGLAGLFRATAKSNKPGLAISRDFDAAIRQHYSQGMLDRINMEFEADAKAAWSRVDSRRGSTAVQRDLEVSIQACCADLGIDFRKLPCLPSLKRVNAFKSFQLTQVRNHDDKTWQNQRYRIRRDYTDCAPMQVVFADVKFCDLEVLKDGMVVRPALVGFLDAGTGRLFPHFVPLPKGQSVDKRDLAEALAAMCADPNWGVPRALYFDNGAEMRGLVEGAAALAANGRHILSKAGMDGIRQIRAMPYNPQAKAIEALFGRLNREVFPAFKGFTRERISNRGPHYKPPTTTWESFVRDIDILLHDYHEKASRRRPSANQRLVAKAEIFKPIVLSMNDLAAVFGTRIQRTVVQGAITVGKIRRANAATMKRLSGKIEALVGVDGEVFVRAPDGQLTRTTPEAPFAVTDPAGIQASEAGELRLLAEMRNQEEHARASGENTAAIHATFRAMFRMRHRDGLRASALSVAVFRQPRAAVQARAAAAQQRLAWTERKPIFTSVPPLNADLQGMLERLEQQRGMAVVSSVPDLRFEAIIRKAVTGRPDRVLVSLAKGASVAEAERAITHAIAKHAGRVDLLGEAVSPSTLQDFAATLGRCWPGLILVQHVDRLLSASFTNLFSKVHRALAGQVAVVYFGDDKMLLDETQRHFDETKTFAQPTVVNNADIFCWTLDHLTHAEVVHLAMDAGATPTAAEAIADRVERGLLVPTRAAMRAELKAARQNTAAR